ncbi:MAG: photosynthetic complex assembly protein PuhC [Burkholderiaceae bacterium]
MNKNFAAHHSSINAQPAVPVIARWILMGLALLMLSVFTLRQSGVDVREIDAPVIWKKSLRFEDGSQGEIFVFDTRTEQKIATFEGEQGFLRGTLRALVRERKKRSIGSETAFELSGHNDGQMILSDPATGEAIHLVSFGPDNSQIYRKLK